MIEGSGGGASGGSVNGPIVSTGKPTSNPSTNGASSAAVTSGGEIIVGYDEEKNHSAGKNGLAKGNSSCVHTPNQRALLDLGREVEINASRKGKFISYEDAKIIDAWANEYGIPQGHDADLIGSGKHWTTGWEHTHLWGDHIPFVR